MMAISRRTALLGLGVSGMTGFAPARAAAPADAPIQIGGRPAALSVSAVGQQIVRLVVTPVDAGQEEPAPPDGSLVEEHREAPIVRVTSLSGPRTVACGGARVTLSAGPPAVRIVAADERIIQQIRFNAQTGGFTFYL